LYYIILYYIILYIVLKKIYLYHTFNKELFRYNFIFFLFLISINYKILLNNIRLIKIPINIWIIFYTISLAIRFLFNKTNSLLCIAVFFIIINNYFFFMNLLYINEEIIIIIQRKIGFIHIYFNFFYYQDLNWNI